mmetsp:Transcript_95231/g.116600  ORF Transcript_95231/g.116600 Transcript_95231/m.116600 type:complete len:402 (+) Transcript_95231:37-1242(+)
MPFFLIFYILIAFFGDCNGKTHCFNKTFDGNGRPIRYNGDYNLTSQDGVFKLNGERFNLKGLSWFGFETSQYVFHGLWAQDYHTLIDFMKNYSFNAIRIPFSCEGVINNPIPNSINFYQMNQDLQNLTSLQVLDKMITALGDAGILVLLDMHSLETGGYLEDGLWYDDKYPQTTTMQVWETMVNRYKGFWNVIAIDVFNEPFDGTWGTGTVSTDFNTWCQTVGNQVHGMGVDWLIFCEGVANSPPCTDACFWGGDLQGVKSQPVTLNMPNKIVYSPHCYGPDVAYQDYFQASNFPDNMPEIWDTHFGYIRSLNKAATALGEWGGSTQGLDGTWMNAFANYIIQTDIPDTFFWCLNPDSGDTGGLLEYDWSTPVQPKLDILQKIQPKPTKVVNEGNQVCFEF